MFRVSFGIISFVLISISFYFFVFSYLLSLFFFSFFVSFPSIFLCFVDEFHQVFSIQNYIYIFTWAKTLCLVLLVFYGKNDHFWSCSTKIVMSSETKFKFVVGSLNELDKSNSFGSVWWLCNNIMVLWIVASVSNPI